MDKIGLVAGTRPEAIKVMPIYIELRSRTGIMPVLISTGQHRELLHEVFEIFHCQPDVCFDIMEHNQSLGGLTQNLINVFDSYFSNNNFNAILVQGDTTSAMAAGLVAFYNRLPVGHIEAGLRTGNIDSPFPEELNRRIVSLTAKWHFAPTDAAAANLRREGVSGRVYQVGNSVIDAALMVSGQINERINDLKNRFPFLDSTARRHVLVTAHRRESFGKGIQSICSALDYLANHYPDIEFLFPVHPNPQVKIPIGERLGAVANIHLISPLAYDEALFVMKHAFLVVTDSGGIQEEAPAFDVPVIVMRENTERPEGVDAGCSVLAGVRSDRIINAFEALVEDTERYRAMSTAPNPYGDGKTSKRIADILCDEL